MCRVYLGCIRLSFKGCLRVRGSMVDLRVAWCYGSVRRVLGGKGIEWLLRGLFSGSGMIG